jgi:hypothetical protein
MKELLIQLATKNRRKMSSEVVIALEKHLEAHGLPFIELVEIPAAPAKKGAKKK